MLEPAEHYLEANGLRHRVLEWNPSGQFESEPLTLVACHGYLDHAYSFQFLADALATENVRLLAADFRGHGHSDWIPKGSYYYFPDYILDLRAWISQLVGDAHFHLLGHSMGGTAASMFASLKPKNLLSLTLVEGLGPGHLSPEGAAGRFNQWIAEMESESYAKKNKLGSLEEAAMRLKKTHIELSDDKAQFLAEKASRTNDDGQLEWCFDPLHRTTSPIAFRADVFSQMLSQIEVPTLLVSGTKGFHPIGEEERIAHLKNKHEVSFEGATHMIHWHQSKELAQAWLEHLSSL